MITFDAAAFRAQFPVFANAGTYPNAVLQGYFDVATTIVDNADNACYMLTGAARVQALNYLTAHIATIAGILLAGQDAGQVRAASIDKVRVEMTPPPNASQFEWWLNQTGYGGFVATILQVNSAGGLWAGVGYPERAGFRKAGGGF